MEIKRPHFYYLCRHIIPLFFCAKFPLLTQTASSDYALMRLKRTYTFIRSKIIYNFQEKSPPGIALLENSGSCPPIWIQDQPTSCRLPDQRTAISCRPKITMRDSIRLNGRPPLLAGEKGRLISKPDSYS